MVSCTRFVVLYVHVAGKIAKELGEVDQATGIWTRAIISTPQFLDNISKIKHTDETEEGLLGECLHGTCFPGPCIHRAVEFTPYA